MGLIISHALQVIPCLNASSVCVADTKFGWVAIADVDILPGSPKIMRIIW